MALVLKTVSAAHGPRWVREAFALWAKKPLPFSALFAGVAMVVLLLSSLPLLGVLVMVAMPLISLGFMVAARSALEGGHVTPLQLLEPLRGDPQRRRGLIQLGLLYGAGSVLILLLVQQVSNDAFGRLNKLMATSGDTQPQIEAVLAEPGLGTAMLLGLLLSMALSIPLWHAPALVHWGGQKAAQALFSSTLAVWRNRGAFLTYMVTWMGVFLAGAFVVTLLAVILGAPQAAGLLAVPVMLVCWACFFISVLFSFNDSFGVAGEPRGTQAGTEPAADGGPSGGAGLG